MHTIKPYEVIVQNFDDNKTSISDDFCPSLSRALYVVKPRFLNKLHVIPMSVFYLEKA